MNHVRITSKTTGSGTIEVDGQDVSGSIRSFTLTAGVGRITELDLEVVPRLVAEFDGQAFIRLTPDFEAFLTGLGWTPPRRP